MSLLIKMISIKKQRMYKKRNLLIQRKKMKKKMKF